MSSATAGVRAFDAFEIRKEVRIAAPVEIAFEALLEELGPENEAMEGRPMPMKLEPWPGGRWFRDMGDGVGHLWGHVQVIKPPTLIEINGPMPMSYPAVNHVQYRLAADGDGCRLSFVHQAMGLILPEHRDGMDRGWEYKLVRVTGMAERKAKASRGQEKK